MVQQSSASIGRPEQRTNSAAVCRGCQAGGLKRILWLGNTPLANALLEPDQLQAEEPRYPLDLVFCPACSLVQITETVAPEQLFRNYAYFSSFSDTMLDHARRLAAEVIERRQLHSQSLVVEVASNDGYLLRNYVERGIPVCGIEPARNIAAVAREQGVDTVCEFFGHTVAEQLAAAGRRADVIHANNVLAHVADLHGVMQGFRALVKDDGVIVVEAPYVGELVKNVEFDTVYHEHLCYFSFVALSRLAERHGLKMIDVARIPIHGGSLRVTMARQESEQAVMPSVAQLTQSELSAGMDDLSYYAPLGEKVETLRRDLVTQLAELKSRHRRIAAYGASAKGSTLLNYFGLGAETIDYVVDRSTEKQGRYTPGTHLKIHDPSKLLTDRPDYVLLLTWNFADEIFAQQHEYRAGGGKFIVPIPEVRVA